jgi:hypothetical protein
MNTTEIADSIDDLADRVAQRLKADRLEIASLYTRLARANEQVVRTIESVLSEPGNLERSAIDKLTADLHGATIAVESYDTRSKVVKADAIAKSIASAQARTTESGNKKIAAAIKSIEVTIALTELSLPEASDGKYEFYELKTGIRCWLEIGGASPNCIWQLPENTPYRSGNLSLILGDGEAIYGYNCSAQPETFWKSIDGTSWEQIDEVVYRQIEIARSEVRDESFAIPVPNFNFVPVQPVMEDPDLKRTKAEQPDIEAVDLGIAP